jgi:quercetin dioxygenase-like cupin family protein
MKKHIGQGLLAAALATVLAGVGSAAQADTLPPDGAVKELLSRDVVGASGKEVRMLTVEYLPGGASLPHRHNAQVFVYVLQGAVRMQIQGAAAVTLGPGKTFYEGPDDIHSVSANASKTKSARILVFMIKDKGAPGSVPVTQAGQP